MAPIIFWAFSGGTSYAYNLLLPVLICLAATWLLSCWHNTTGAAVLLILFLIGISPAFSLLSWANEPVLPLDKLVSALLHPFRILYESGSWAANPLLGLQTEPARGWLLAFWVLFLAGGVIFTVGKHRKLRNTLAVLALLLSLVSLGLSYLPAASYRITDQWNGVYQDYHTYDDQPAGLEESTADFTVTSYDLSLSFGRYMQVEGKLHISAQEPRSQFICRLYPLNELALFGDYILTWSDGLSMQNLSTQIFLSQNADSKLAGRICGYGSLADTPAETLENWLNYLTMAEDNDSFSQLLKRTLEAAKTAGQGEDAVKEIARFLCTPNAVESERAFLEEMCIQYASNS